MRCFRPPLPLSLVSLFGTHSRLPLPLLVRHDDVPSLYVQHRTETKAMPADEAVRRGGWLVGGWRGGGKEEKKQREAAIRVCLHPSLSRRVAAV